MLCHRQEEHVRQPSLKWKANLQKVRIEENGEKKTVYVSARALKKGKIKRA